MTIRTRLGGESRTEAAPHRRKGAALGTTSNRPDRTAARAIGILILIGWLTYGPGSLLVESVTGAEGYPLNVPRVSATVVVGAVLMLLNSAAVVALGVMWFPILRRHSERVALGYFGVRVFEALTLAVGVIALLALARVASDPAAPAAGESQFTALGTTAASINSLSYEVGMAGLGVGSLFFCYLLYRTQLVPRPLAAWGIVGYAVFAAGAILEMFGIGAGLVLTIPGGLFELTLATWLIVKGLNPRALAPQTVTANSR